MHPQLTNIFEHLHAHPEISWEEHNTTAYIKNLLEEYGCEVKTFDSIPGLVTDIGEGRPVVALRADIDAVWQEVNGTFQANHSCGHDAHMTIAIGVIRNLLEEGPPHTGTFRFIFQPAEEKGTGAATLVDQGVVDDVDVLYGMHLRPNEELANGHFAPAIQHGAAKFLQGTIRGDDAHGARPHLNTNAIQVGMDIAQQLNNIHINPMIPHSAKMTTFHAGGKSPNIIPGNADFSIDLRAQTNEVMQELMDKIKKLTHALATYHHVDIELEVGADVPAAVIDPEAKAVMQAAISENVGNDKRAPTITTTGGDDFHFYTIKRPDLKATMLAIGCDLKPGLHHPQMTFDRDAIPTTIEILTTTLKKRQAER
ncbi:amidohydrolase [Natribacillus halophilus]|uniref:Amidohydrolase n=1 Tax=Natribacillus halophilus TaxID=549003 RepID=A0A1G8MV75_9BACI|nr:amidohydrolase [Natribacillus halophilus]SDI71773.1 amidohydrolase [Natribacillus halophilus]